MLNPFRVALTFDAEHPDRPAPADGTERVLATLAAASVPASFFLQGRWVQAYPALARSVADAGHLIGNHSHYHARMPLLTGSAVATDVRSAERAIRRATGQDPRPWFRCPFGDGTHDTALVEELARLGYRETRWDVDGLDWQVSMSGPRLARHVVAETIARGDGAVVLLHPWTRATGRGLTTIIAGLRGAGARFVRLDALG